MGLVDINEQKKISIIQVAVCVVLFLISGFFSYRYLIAPEIKRLQNARKEYVKERALLRSMSEEAQRVNALANNAQLLEAELVSLRNRVFNTDAEILNFVRSLPMMAVQTNNALTSIVPQQTREMNVSAETSSDSKSNIGGQTTDQTTSAPKALPYGMKPIELSFTGDYNAVIGFLNTLKSTGQYITISSLDMKGGTSDKPSEVSVKLVLNLVKIGINVNTLPIQVAKLNQAQQQTANKQQSTSLASNAPDANAVKTLISAQNAIYAQRNAQTTVKIASPPQTTSEQVSPPSPSIPTPKVVATATVSQKPQTQTPITQVKTNQVTVVAKQTPVNTNESTAVTPAQKTKQMQTEVKSETKKADTETVASSPKPTESKTQPVTKPASVSLSKQPVAVTKQPIQSYTDNKTTSTKTPSKISQKVEDQKQTVETQKEAKQVAKQSTQTVSPTETTTNSSVSKRQYAVRVGKFSYYENAENLVKTLKSHSYNPWIKTYSYGGKTTYWVYVGTFGTKKEAEKFAESMQKRLAYIDDYVIMGLKSKNSKDS